MLKTRVLKAMATVLLAALPVAVVNPPTVSAAPAAVVNLSSPTVAPLSVGTTMVPTTRVDSSAASTVQAPTALRSAWGDWNRRVQCIKAITAIGFSWTVAAAIATGSIWWFIGWLAYQGINSWNVKRYCT